MSTRTRRGAYLVVTLAPFRRIEKTLAEIQRTLTEELDLSYESGYTAGVRDAKKKIADHVLSHQTDLFTAIQQDSGPPILILTTDRVIQAIEAIEVTPEPVSERPVSESEGKPN